MATNINEENKIMYKDLSYKLQGLFFDIRNDLGSGHKESIYQKALEKELTRAGIKFIKEPPIKIYSQKGEFLGLYRPDFLVEDKIIIELKAVEYISRQETARVYDYLRNSKYELAYFVNFSSPQLFIKRLIFTNDRKTRMVTNIKRITTNVLLFVAISTLFIGISRANFATAASLYFKSPATEIGINQIFKIDLFIDTEEEQINTISGEIVFPADLLELQEVSDGNSVINAWLERPNITRIATNEKTNNNEFVFSGIIPGGYRDKNGLIFSLIFKSIAEGQGMISVRNSKSFLNDGQGTETATRSQGFPFVAISAPIRGDSWVSPKDTDPPEEFKPEIATDPAIFEGKWFLVFATQDKGAGIDHYEILETSNKKQATKNNGWFVAESPYVLKDQDLKSFIYVKAVDNAGNERVATVEPRYPPKWYGQPLIWCIIILVIIFLFIVIKRNLWKKLLPHE